MKFEFAKYYDVTKIAHNLSHDYRSFEKVFVCVDTWDFWIVRIQKDINKDYDRKVGKWLLERNKIEKESKMEGIPNEKKLLKILQEDLDNGFENWDNEDADSYDEIIEMVDAGFGIGETN